VSPQFRGSLKKRHKPITASIKILPLFRILSTPQNTNGFPSDIFFVKCGAEGQKVLAHTSNFRPVKRVPDVIRIFNEVQKKIPSILLLIGDGPDRSQCEILCRELGIGDKVRFLGKQMEIVPLLSTADLFLMPSQSESFGLAALEAMACEVPLSHPASAGCRNCRCTDRLVSLRRSATSIAWHATPSTCFPIRSSTKCLPKLPEACRGIRIDKDHTAIRRILREDTVKSLNKRDDLFYSVGF